MTFSSLNTDPEKDRAWRRRGAERYAERVRERGGRRPLERRSELQPMSQRKLDELAARGTAHPSSSLKQAAPKRRPPDEAEIARVWHDLNTRGRLCVKCGRAAGPWAHHIVPQRFLKDHALHAHLWDHQNAAPVDNDCHMNHEAWGVNDDNPITRAELQAAGRWDDVVDWARWLDARYFPGAHPVESRLERDYPAGGAR